MSFSGIKSIKYLLLLALLSVVACTTIKCFVKDKVVGAVTTVLVEKLECQNSDAVKVSMDKLVDSLGVCTTPQQTGPIAAVVCPVLVKSVVDFVADKAVPAEWMCKATSAKAVLSAALTTACSQIPVSE